MIGKSQYLQPLLFDGGFPDVVVLHLLSAMMNASFELNHQTMFVAIEVGEIWHRPIADISNKPITLLR